MSILVLFVFSAPGDYTPTHNGSTVTLDSATSAFNVFIPTVNNIIYELKESLSGFLILLEGTSHLTVRLSPARACVSILDDDSMNLLCRQCLWIAIL